ncbi:hypothetical protein [Pedobacter zeae]|uniref:PQQ-like domain-containing protein n=1 Tax=Pedobacter zeae TaxID=1737356 RepID=A0A7W6P4V5_9SPHI|nr:hypothetical protein [Pedobacter zeae]MBB4106269.1 hypothetical protein [Pedobacter zeae]GGH00618.1 hypothetical protein GCM10007422_13990 [Pedobacter zeae]
MAIRGRFKHSNNFCFYIIDLNKNKQIGFARNITSTLESNGIMYDIYNDTLIYMSLIHPDTLYIKNWRKGTEFKKKIDINKTYTASKLIMDSRGVFFVEAVKGFGFFDLKMNKFYHFDGGIANYYLNTVSTPISKELNLISRVEKNKNNLQFLALDDKSNVKWIYSVKSDNIDSTVDIFNYESFFIVKCNNKIFALKKLTGELAWKRNFSKPISNVYQYKEQLLIGFLPKLSNVDHEIRNECNFFLISVNDNKYIWTKKIISYGNVVAGIINSQLIFSDDRHVINYSLNSGNEINEMDLKNKYYYGAFTTIRDLCSSKLYFLMPDEKIYW